MLQAVLSADFYGTSYAVFPRFEAIQYLDISLNFRTYFSDGLILFIGSAAQVSHKTDTLLCDYTRALCCVYIEHVAGIDS